MGERGVGFKVLWPLTLATLVVGCASHPGKTSDADLTHLDQWLPGHYDNRAQVADDRRAGHVPHDARTLLIATVNSMMVGTHVFYLEERTADSERRILQQHIISFDVVGSFIVETPWELTEPPRWRDAETNTDLFTSLQPRDLKQIRGCQLTWKKDGTRFVGADDRQRCRTSAPDGGTMFVETRIELSNDGLGWSERGYAPDGKMIQGRQEDPFIRFVRH
jgi:hypothetical protein